jgi:phosphoribosylformimino-5-aminoimidazole carboxamide ribotide isomerase
MKFKPCIDLHGGKVKQIVGGTLSDGDAAPVENYVSEHGAEYYAELYKKDDLKGGHVIMLGPGNQDEALKALRAFSYGLQVGGGITNENAQTYLEAKASHVIVTSFVFKNGQINFDNLDKLIREIGKEKLVLDLSFRKKDGIYYVVTDRWQKFTEFEVNKKNLEELSNYCDEFLIHAADVEGKCEGVQSDIIETISDWDIVLTTYAGGVRTMEDVLLVNEIGKSKIDLTVGSALDIFGGSLKYQELVGWHKKNN